jgi:hypothetical protein
VVETAEVIAEAAVVESAEAVVDAEDVVVPVPEAVAATETAIPEAVATPEPACDAVASEPAPDATHDALWAAAEMVAKAASANTAPFIAVAPAPLPLAAAPPAPIPAPQPEPVVVPPVPPFMTTLRNAPNSLQWAVFGGTAAFLGVIWVAIWFAVGK